MRDEKKSPSGNAPRENERGSDRDEKKTGAGQEANQGAPEQHDREHQSNYGGGGPHGGAK